MPCWYDIDLDILYFAVVYGLWWHHTLTSIGAVFFLLLVILAVVRIYSGRQGKFDMNSG